MLVVGADKKVESRTVTLGPLVDGLRVVRKGLAPGELVVINGLQRVRPGAQVNATVAAMQWRDGRCAMKFSSFFITRPIFAAVLSAVIVVAGGLALLKLPISEYPAVVPPTVIVRAAFPGANPKVIAETVAAPLEQQMNGVENMLYMFSQATSDGALTLTITFAVGTDLDNAQVQVQNRVAQALPRLPQDVQRIGVTTEKASPDFLLIAHLVSPDERYDMLYLSNYALLRVKDELARLPGVGAVQVFGAGEYSMRVWLDPNRLASRQLTATDVVRAIREQNIQVAAGVLGAPPAPSGATFQLTINAQGRLTTEEEFGHIVVRATKEGQITRLADVARLELGSSRYSLRSLLDNKPAVAIGVFQRPGTNALQASADVHATMERLKQSFPPGVDYRIVYDPTVYVRESISAVAHTLFEAILLVVLVVVVFLQTWRASIIPLVAVPVSLIGTLRGDARARLLAQHALPLRPRARHRHRGRRRDRGGRERGAAHRAGAGADGGDAAGDGGGLGPDRRDRARPLRRVRADRVRQRAHRPVLPAVRADDRDLDPDFGLQLADPEPGPRLPAAAGPRRAARPRAAGDRPAVRLVLPRLQPRVRAAARRSTRGASRGCCGWPRWRSSSTPG